ncbi:MAG: ABC transporter ATP-binding protein, partial [Hydrogenoanaerobacterium sp.]
FKAGPGETTAIIGSTGSGKTTLLNLIPRLYDATEGKVLVDGIDVKAYNQTALRDKIGYIPQKAVLFTGTIADNIRYGDENATQEELTKAASIAQSLNFIMDTHIAQGGTNVSGGQKQRLAIARAIVKKPEIYLFDDSFSALDFKTDAALRAALKPETKEATVIIVAQRVSTIMDANRILVLDEGAVVGEGTHRELLESCEVYKEIVSSQLSVEEIAKGGGK